MANSNILSKPTTLAMLDECEKRYQELLSCGVNEDVACDRVWDAYEAAFLGLDRHCFDPRDRLFESSLRTIAARDNG